MTRRKSDLVRPFRPERVSRETMAYLLDMSPDTFDRLVASGRLPAARKMAGIKRWDADAVMLSWDGLDVAEAVGSAAEEQDRFLEGVRKFSGKTQSRRRAS